MKVFDIAFKDMLRSLRSASALVFMFGVPLLVTGMFSLMFGNIARQGEFNLPPVNVVIANLDEGGPNLHLGGKNVPGNIKARTMGELVVKILQSDDFSKLVDVRLAPDASAARLAVDSRQAQVAVTIPADFSRQFIDPYGKAVIEFYQDPTLTIGPGILKSILSQFMDGMAGIKIASDVAINQLESADYNLAGPIVQEYLSDYMLQDDDLTASMLMVVAPNKAAAKTTNPLLSILAPIMAGMMVFYAFFTGTSTAESILREEEERTLPRLFTTPTPQVSILTGKLLAVFLTVSVQIIVMLIAGRLVFGIEWGEFTTVGLMAAGVVFAASSFGIFINSLLKNTKQGGVIFGPVLAITGMLGMISVFGQSLPSAAKLGDTVSLLVPQGWGVKGFLQTIGGALPVDVLPTALGLLVWGAVFFLVGVRRFNQRYR